MMQVLSHEEGFRQSIAAALRADRTTSRTRVLTRMRAEEFARLIVVCFECAERLDRGDETAKVYLRNMADRAETFRKVVRAIENDEHISDKAIADDN